MRGSLGGDEERDSGGSDDAVPRKSGRRNSAVGLKRSVAHEGEGEDEDGDEDLDQDQDEGKGGLKKGLSVYETYQMISSPGSGVVLGKRARRPVLRGGAWRGESE